jgi:hypothetical protein
MKPILPLLIFLVSSVVSSPLPFVGASLLHSVGDDSHVEYRTAKQLVQKYLDNPRSIIVYV